MAAGTNFRARFVFEDTLNDIGWTETYFGVIPPGAPAGWQTTVFTALNPWITARLAIMQVQAFLSFIVISDDNFPGDSVLFQIGSPAGIGTFATSLSSGPTDAMLVRMDSPDGKYHSRKFYHASPVGNFTQRVYTPGPAFLAAFGTFQLQTLASGLLMKNIQKPVAVPPVLIYNQIGSAQVVRLRAARGPRECRSRRSVR